MILAGIRHPLRRKILGTIVRRGTVSPRIVADELDEPLSNVSYHVRVLSDCRLVELVEATPVRGSLQHFYRATVKESWVLALLDPSPEGGS